LLGLSNYDLVQGDQIGQFSPFWLLFKSPGVLLGENMVCVGIYRAQKVFNVDALDFEIELW